MLSGELNDARLRLTAPLWSAAECHAVADLDDDDDRFRATIDMARYRFGEGRYRYFDVPLPDAVAEIRATFWPHLLPIARDWAERLGRPQPWPDELDEWLAQCHAAGQTRSTPLLLSYGPGDWNTLHRDLYGDLVFPIQVVIGLDRPGRTTPAASSSSSSSGLVRQSRATATVIGQGQGLIFTTSDRPVESKRGWSAAPMRHGVSVVRSGRRRTLGLVFHDAK